MNETAKQEWLNRINNYLAEFGWKHNDIPPLVVNTGDNPGTTFLSRDPGFPSAAKPHFIKLNGITDQKRFGGIPDELFKNGSFEEHYEPPPPFSEKDSIIDLTAAVNEGRNLELRKRICQAYTAYLFGNSEKVSSYKEIINSVHFPCYVAVFAGQEIFIKKGHPLVIKAKKEVEPVVLVFNTIRIEPGGEIVCQADTTIFCQTLSNCGTINGYPVDDPAAIHCIAPSGKHGYHGEQGKDGEDGIPGEPAKQNEKGCIANGGHGTPGQHGNHGHHGGNGERGQDGFTIMLDVFEMRGNFLMGNFGGSGGNGGNAGNGGKGGNGGIGGFGDYPCNPGNTGPGGSGGNGGDGGMGGNAGNGKNIYFSYKKSPQRSPVTAEEPFNTPGKGGSGGKGGPPGNGNPNGLPGSNGKNGPNGLPGIPGKLFVNGKFKE